MIVNFRAHEISRGTRKLARTPTLIIIIIIKIITSLDIVESVNF
jgi:hypothetical protein